MASKDFKRIMAQLGQPVVSKREKTRQNYVKKITAAKMKASNKKSSGGSGG